MKKCFVIQPFDKGLFDKRYRDIFEPAIIGAGFEPYRVDKDLSVKVPIEEIEKGIRSSDLCFAEITTDNPNVWYELGFAFACKKDVILICESAERKGKFPFDIQHRHVITYESNSSSDFDQLKNEITSKMTVIASKQKKIEELIDDPVKESQGLKQHEITLMVMMVSNQLTDADSVSVFSLQKDMEKTGFTTAAVGLAMRNLKRLGLIKFSQELDDWNNQKYSACRLTEKGESWVLSNQDKFKMTLDEDTFEPEVASNDIPF